MTTQKPYLIVNVYPKAVKITGLDVRTKDAVTLNVSSDKLPSLIDSLKAERDSEELVCGIVNGHGAVCFPTRYISTVVETLESCY